MKFFIIGVSDRHVLRCPGWVVRLRQQLSDTGSLASGSGGGRSKRWQDLSFGNDCSGQDISSVITYVTSTSHLVLILLPYIGDAIKCPCFLYLCFFRHSSMLIKYCYMVNTVKKYLDASMYKYFVTLLFWSVYIVSLSQLVPGFWFKLYSKLGNSSACESIYEIYVNIIFLYFSSMPTLSSLQPRSHLPPRTRMNLKQMFDHLSKGLRSEAFKAKWARVSPNCLIKRVQDQFKTNI